MTERPNIVIIGGGIGGVATAAHLAEDKNVRDKYDIYVVEMLGGLGRGTTSRAYGIASGTMGSRKHMVKLNVESRKVYQDEFEKRFGTKLDLKPVGSLALGMTDDMVDYMEKQTPRQNEVGLETRMLSPEEIKRMIPDLNTEGVIAGQYSPTDFLFNPAQIIDGYRRFAERQGVHVATRTEAIGLVMEGDKIAGVKTTDGFIPTEKVFNAAGIRAGTVGEWAGQKLPVKIRDRALLTVNLKDSPGNIPLIGTWGDPIFERCYVGPSEPHQIKVGVVRGDFEGDLTSPGVVIPAGPEEVDMTKRYLARFFPTVKISDEPYGHIGIRSETDDHRPILGPAEGVRNLYHIAGLGSNGIEDAPAFARLITKSIREDREGEKDPELEMFSAERFKPRIDPEREILNPNKPSTRER